MPTLTIELPILIGIVVAFAGLFIAVAAFFVRLNGAVRGIQVLERKITPIREANHALEHAVFMHKVRIEALETGAIENRTVKLKKGETKEVKEAPRELPKGFLLETPSLEGPVDPVSLTNITDLLLAALGESQDHNARVTCVRGVNLTGLLDNFAVVDLFMQLRNGTPFINYNIWKNGKDYDYDYADEEGWLPPQALVIKLVKDYCGEGGKLIVEKDYV